MLKNPVEYERNISSVKFNAISRQVSPDSLLGVSTGIFQRAVAYESETIIAQIGTQYIKMVAVHGTLCTIPPRNINQYDLEYLRTDS
jgi:hypothetical protein